MAPNAVPLKLFGFSYSCSARRAVLVLNRPGSFEGDRSLINVGNDEASGLGRHGHSAFHPLFSDLPALSSPLIERV
jgi:hypothetical protein